jgi:hypothetical protein
VDLHRGGEHATHPEDSRGARLGHVVIVLLPHSLQVRQSHGGEGGGRFCVFFGGSGAGGRVIILQNNEDVGECSFTKKLFAGTEEFNK